MTTLKTPELVQGGYIRTDRNGNDHYKPDYYEVDEVNAYIAKVEQCISELEIKLVATRNEVLEEAAQEFMDGFFYTKEEQEAGKKTDIVIANHILAMKEKE